MSSSNFTFAQEFVQCVEFSEIVYFHLEDIAPNSPATDIMSFTWHIPKLLFFPNKPAPTLLQVGFKRIVGLAQDAGGRENGIKKGL